MRCYGLGSVDEVERPTLSGSDRRSWFWSVSTMHDVQRGHDAKVERRFGDRLTGEDKSGRLVSLAHESRRTGPLEQSGMKEMDHAAAVGNIDPTLDQLRVGLAVAESDDPVA